MSTSYRSKVKLKKTNRWTAAYYPQEVQLNGLSRTHPIHLIIEIFQQSNVPKLYTL